MNTPTGGRADAALDAALKRVLQPPALPPGFRERLRAAIVRAPALDREALRRQLEREQREAMADLRQGYLRLRRDALVGALVAAFVLGGALAWGLPWLQSQYHVDAGLAVTVVVTAVAVGYAAWVAMRGLRMRLQRWLAW